MVRILNWRKNAKNPKVNQDLNDDESKFSSYVSSGSEGTGTMDMTGSSHKTEDTLNQSGNSYTQSMSPETQSRSSYNQTGNSFNKTGSSYNQTGSLYNKTGNSYDQTRSTYYQTGSALDQGSTIQTKPGSSYQVLSQGSETSKPNKLKMTLDSKNDKSKKDKGFKNSTTTEGSQKKSPSVGNHKARTNSASSSSRSHTSLSIRSLEMHNQLMEGLKENQSSSEKAGGSQLGETSNKNLKYPTINSPKPDLIYESEAQMIQDELGRLFPDDMTVITDFTSISRRPPVDQKVIEPTPVSISPNSHDMSPFKVSNKPNDHNNQLSPNNNMHRHTEEESEFIYAPTVLFTENQDHANFIGKTLDTKSHKSYASSIVYKQKVDAPNQNVWDQKALEGTSVIERFSSATNSKFKKDNNTELPVWVSGNILDITSDRLGKSGSEFDKSLGVSKNNLNRTAFNIQDLYKDKNHQTALDFGLNKAAIKYPDAFQNIEVRIVAVVFRSWDSSSLKIWSKLFDIVTSDQEDKTQLNRLREDDPGISIGVLDPMDRLVSTWYSLYEAVESSTNINRKAIFGASKYRVQLPLERSIFVPLEAPLAGSPEITVPIDLDLLLQSSSNEALAAARFQIPITLKGDRWHISSSEIIKQGSSSYNGHASTEANIRSFTLYRADQVLPIQAESDEKRRLLEDLSAVGKVYVRLMQITDPYTVSNPEEEESQRQPFLSQKHLLALKSSSKLYASSEVPDGDDTFIPKLMAKSIFIEQSSGESHEDIRIKSSQSNKLQESKLDKGSKSSRSTDSNDQKLESPHISDLSRTFSYTMSNFDNLSPGNKLSNNYQASSKEAKDNNKNNLLDDSVTRSEKHGELSSKQSYLTYTSLKDTATEDSRKDKSPNSTLQSKIAFKSKTDKPESNFTEAPTDEFTTTSSYLYFTLPKESSENKDSKPSRNDAKETLDSKNNHGETLHSNSNEYNEDPRTSNPYLAFTTPKGSKEQDQSKPDYNSESTFDPKNPLNTKSLKPSKP